MASRKLRRAIGERVRRVAYARRVALCLSRPLAETTYRRASEAFNLEVTRQLCARLDEILLAQSAADIQLLRGVISVDKYREQSGELLRRHPTDG